MCAQTGRRLPDKIANAPQLKVGLNLFYEAFTRLSTDRQIGMGLGPIPWTSILKYADEYQFEGDQRHALFYHVNVLDSAFLNHVRKSNDGKRPRK